jgi:hypothetical protein
MYLDSDELEYDYFHAVLSVEGKERSGIFDNIFFSKAIFARNTSCRWK